MIQETVGGIPAIHAAPSDRVYTPLPTIFFFHGYRSSKELSSFFGYMLAMAGFRVVMPEADMHGARFEGDDGRRLGQFWEILKRNIDELPGYRDHYADKGLIADGRVGVGGTSMGGFAALGCMARYDWIRSAASYMGSGYYLDRSRTVFPPFSVWTPENQAAHAERLAPLADYDPADRLDRLGDRPLFIWHGAQDDIVPYGDSLRLGVDLATHGRTNNLTFIGDPEAGHKVSMDAASAGVTFFCETL